jgi:hypothetical protein
MSPLLRRRIALLACAACAVAPLAGCGNKEEEIKSAETEGAYLDLGQLRYQIQISRQLNPADTEDRAYLEGVAPAQEKLRPGQSWFAVFVRVENDYDTPRQAATDFELSDTQDNVYRPVAIARANPFAYVGGRVPGKSTLPPAQSVAQLNESIGGSLVLFKVKTTSFDNRPLVLKIFGPTVPQDEASLDLDV